MKRQHVLAVAAKQVRQCRFQGRIKASEGEVEFVGSTAAPDRAGDIVEQNWDLDAYKQNPVVLYGHDHGGLPVGKAVSVGVVNGALKFKVQWVPREIHPHAGVVADMYRLGFLKAFSVGFRPLEIKSYADGADRPEGLGPWGSHIVRSELLEVSAVAVPANAEALIGASANGARCKIAPIWRGRNSFTAAASVDRAAVLKWMGEPTMLKEMEPTDAAAPQGEELDAAGLCDATLAILEAEGGVTAESLKAAIEHLRKLRAAMDDAEGEEDPEAEEDPAEDEVMEEAAAPKPGEDEGEEDEEEDPPKPPAPKKPAAPKKPGKSASMEDRIAALEAALAAKSGDTSDEDDDSEIEAALAGDLVLDGLDALETALGLDDKE